MGRLRPLPHGGIEHEGSLENPARLDEDPEAEQAADRALQHQILGKERMTVDDHQERPLPTERGIEVVCNMAPERRKAIAERKAHVED